MALDLLSIFLTKSAEFAVGKALDVAWKCITCEDQNDGRIANVTHNHFYCANCHSDRMQYTNACQTTVARDGKIGHVGYSLDSNWRYITEGELFWKKNIGIQVPGHYLFDGLAGKPLIEINEVIDHDTGQVYYRDKTLWHPESNYDKRSMYLNAYFRDLPDEKLHNRDLYALDFRVETRFGDVLVSDRDVVKL